MKKPLQFTMVTIIFFGAVSVLQGSSVPASQASQVVAPASTGTDPATSRAAREEKALQELQRQRLMQREAAVAAKEAEVKKMSDKLSQQLKALEETKKRYDAAMKAQAEVQKKQQGDKVTKMVKLFKAMKPDQAARLTDALPEQEAVVLLERLDIKTVAKLVPFLKQPRLVRWIEEHLNITR